jgi:ribosomal protein S18 acetylase RimI-like enzyme
VEGVPYSFRPAVMQGETNDLGFLRELYASTRREEMAPSGWPQEQIEAFLFQQFEAQHSYYLEHFSSSDFDLIISASGEPIGRLYLDEREEEFRIIDIALLPESRGLGIGGDILEKILAKASAVGKAVTIHVEQSNRAMALYLRLGFEMVEEQGVYHLMKWELKTKR